MALITALSHLSLSLYRYYLQQPPSQERVYLNVNAPKRAAGAVMSSSVGRRVKLTGDDDTTKRQVSDVTIVIVVVVIILVLGLR